MIGFYNYTELLTYLSLISANLGIIISLSGKGHPYFSVFFLLFCGLCDAFDGKVARIKKDRSPTERKFGIQIDSLSDLVAFGVLPACIGYSIMMRSPIIDMAEKVYGGKSRVFATCIAFIIIVLYVLAAMIRLAYFNVTEEERQKTESGTRKYFVGLPVTSAALIFPFIMLLNYVTPYDVTPMYMGTMVLCCLAFVSRIQIKKPGFKGTMVMVGIGVIEFLLILAGKYIKF